MKTIKEIINDFKGKYNEEDFTNLRQVCNEIEKCRDKIEDLGYYFFNTEALRREALKEFWTESVAFDGLKNDMEEFEKYNNTFRYTNRNLYDNTCVIIDNYEDIVDEIRDLFVNNEDFDYYDFMGIVKEINDLGGEASE